VSVVPLDAARRAVPLTDAGLAALLALGAVVAVGPRPALVALLWLAVVTPRLVAVDIAEHRLPDRLVLPGWPVALAAALLEGVAGGTPALVAAAAGVGYGALLLLLHLAGGMGLGDVKLAPVLGLTAAAASPAAAVASPVLAFLAGGVLAVGVLLRDGAGASIPFGPAMLLGAWAAVLLA
jgi:leader peptidase (prepilin peptidase) / N-methyltransferase